jgi:hypothetical protein
MKTTATLKNYGKDILSGCLNSFDHRYRFCSFFYIPSKPDFKNTTAEEWLYAISQNYKDYTDEDDKGTRRFFKKLPLLVENVEMTEECILASSFCNIMVDRERVITEIKDGKELKECTIKNPYDIDYHLSPNHIAKVLKDWVAESSKKKKKKNQKEFFSVVTRNSNGKIPPCPNCKGEGALRCEHCNGSGREQYVDGYYASGEERIKTGNCPHCYGRGNTQCEACDGEGKPQIYADNYQIVKSVENKQTVLRYDCISGVSSIWEMFEDAYSGNISSDISSAEIRGKELDENDIKAINARRYFLQDNNNDYWDDSFWCECDNEELEPYIDKLYKNQNEIIIDHDGQPTLAMLKEKGKEYTALYQENKDAAYGKWEEMDLLKGQIGCALEYHALLPVIKINCTNKQTREKITIFIFEYHSVFEDTNETACIIEGTTELKFWDALFL